MYVFASVGEFRSDIKAQGAELREELRENTELKGAEI